MGAIHNAILLGAIGLGGCSLAGPTAQIGESTFGERGSNSSVKRIRADSHRDRANDDRALVRAARARAEKECAGDFVVRQTEFSDAWFIKHADGRRQPIRTVFMNVQCAAEPRGKIQGTGALLVQELSASAEDTDFFDIHAETFTASYARVFSAIRRVLARRGDLVWRVDERKGTIITAATLFDRVWSWARYDQFFIVCDEEKENQTKVTFKLISRWQDKSVGGEPVMKPYGRDVVYGHAARFIADIRSELGRR